MSISDARTLNKSSIIDSLKAMKDSVNNPSSVKYQDNNCLLTYEKSRSISFSKNCQEFKLILFGNYTEPLYFNSSGDIIKTVNVMLKILSIN